jgi:hypothetical protein
MHRRGSVDGVRHGLETRQQAVTEAFDKGATMTREYLGDDNADEVSPSANAGGFMLAHEPNRFHQISQQNDGLLAHKPNLRSADVGSLGLHCAFVDRIIVHAEPASHSGFLAS